MKRTILLALLGAALALPAQAFEWPWQSQQDVRYGYCMGFVMAGLASDQMASTSRTDMWLTWNYVNREELPESSITPEDFQAGQAEFSTLLANGDFQGIREVSDSECYLGRNRHSSPERIAEA